jgi:DNA-binding NtrC family response regulator
MMDVLIVEDDELQREALTAELEEAGLEVESVEAAEPALRLLEFRGAPPVVLTDLALGPGICGLELGEVVLRGWPDVAVIYLTGHPQALCGRAIGVRECVLPKPVGPELVAGLVRRLIGVAPLG